MLCGTLADLVDKYSDTVTEYALQVCGLNFEERGIKTRKRFCLKSPKVVATMK